MPNTTKESKKSQTVANYQTERKEGQTILILSGLKDGASMTVQRWKTNLARSPKVVDELKEDLEGQRARTDALKEVNGGQRGRGL
ncbi:hypothetical protein U1Q18_007694 [Sarracenia purpurea var. burkii]